jgi:uncharacterized cupin superfamily protein
MLTLTLLVVASVGFAFMAGSANAKLRKDKAPSAAVTMAPADLKWEAMPGVEGVQVAKLWGDMEKGGYGAFVKLPADQKHPLHTHSSTVKCVVLSGEFIYTPEGGTEHAFGPGSYLMIPAGMKHTSASGSGELMMFQESTGKWDMKPVMESAAAK